MGPLISAVITGNDQKMIQYVRSRVESDLNAYPSTETLIRRLKRITPAKVTTKLTYLYLDLVSRLVPKNLRSMVWSGTSIGEKHRWMYDRFGLALLLKDCGYENIQFLAFDESAIPGFCEDGLDSNPDGRSYKNVSIYCEATKVNLLKGN